MNKKWFAFICLVLVSMFTFVDIAGATEAELEIESAVVTVVTTSPLEVVEGEQFAVAVEITYYGDKPVTLVALSSANEVLAESELVVGLQAGVAREVLLYGTSEQAGLMDISQIQIVDGEDTILETLYIDAFLIKVQAKQDTMLLRMGAFTVSKYTNNEFTLTFPLKNLGEITANNISIQFNSEQVFLRGNSNVLQVPNVDAGNSKNVSVKMGLASTEGTVYSIPIIVTCDLPTGDKVSFDEIITVTAADLGIKPTPDVVGTPRVFLKKYTLSQGSILAGDTVKLTLYVENSSSREVCNLKISLAPIPAENSTSGTVFSPVNSSNSFYVNRIAAKKTYTKVIDIYVDPNAAAKTYLVPIEILYEDAQGTSFSAAEMVNIPVLQESRLQVLSVEAPPIASLGEPTPISAEFVNVGKVALKNLVVTIEGDFPTENASFFLASFEIGQSEFFQAYIIPQTEGPLEGNVVFTYTDNTNQDVVTTMLFQMDVQEMGMPGPGGPEEPRPIDPPASGRNYLAWIVTILLVLIFVGVVLWRRRAKRGEMFDEEL
ncbi:MAG: hypothetical protein NUK65_03640 [Firmicutes bacterium]|nr:hypothetical protein [Bacillota bacterium]